MKKLKVAIDCQRKRNGSMHAEQELPQRIPLEAPLKRMMQILVMAHREP